MAINPNCTLGGKLLSLHDEFITTQLHPDVERYKAKLKENIMDSKAWLDYAVSLSDYHWINRDAVDAISMAIAIDPFVAEYHFFRGYCHQKLGLLQEAAADFEMAWKLDGNHVNAAYYLGMTYFYMGEYERAYHAYKGLYRISPPDAEWAANANWAYLTCMKLGKKEEAQEMLKPITPESTPTQSVGTLGNVWDDAYYLMACQIYHGWVSPEEQLEKAKAKDDDGDTYRALNMFVALYYDVQGETDKALEHYKLALEFSKDPNSPSAKWVLRPRIAELSR